MEKITIKLINEFTTEKQPNFKMALANKIKQLDNNIYNDIMQQNNLKINNKDYCFDKNTKKYKLYI